MRIGEVAKRLNIPPSTIRYYEKKGLIAVPDRVSGKRKFDDKTLVRLQFIQLSQAAGFTLSEIQSLLTQYAENSSRSGPWLPAVEVKRAEVRTQIRELLKTEAILDELVKCQCNTIEQCVSVAMTETTSDGW